MIADPADQQELIFGEFERLEADTAKPGIGTSRATRIATGAAIGSK